MAKKKTKAELQLEAQGLGLNIMDNSGKEFTVAQLKQILSDKQEEIEQLEVQETEVESDKKLKGGEYQDLKDKDIVLARKLALQESQIGKEFTEYKKRAVPFEQYSKLKSDFAEKVKTNEALRKRVAELESNG